MANVGDIVYCRWCEHPYAVLTQKLVEGEQVPAASLAWPGRTFKTGDLMECFDCGKSISFHGFIRPPERIVKCTCGAQTIGVNSHSSWCDAS